MILSYNNILKYIGIFVLIIIIITLLLILLNWAIFQWGNHTKDPLEINTPSKIIASKTYYKCEEKYHNRPTAEVLIDSSIERVDDYKECDLYIPCGYNLVEMELYIIKDLKPTTIIYGIVGCDNIVSKNNLWDILENQYGRKDAVNYMPLTFVVDNDEHLLELRENHSKGDKYILKKNVQRKKGLFITDSIDYIMKNANTEDFIIIQKYIKEPLLINKRKLNIRIYVAIVYKSRKTRLYLYYEGKCIYTNKDYLSEGVDDDFERNITSFNLDNDIYLKNPLLLEDLRIYLNNVGTNNTGDKLLEDIYILIKNVCLPMKPEICNNYPNIIDNTCFQLFGGDVIVTRDYKPLLLEFNKGPSMTTEIVKDQQMKKGLIEDTFKLAGVVTSSDNSHLDRFKEL
jgi:hypothetical protein